ncbi:MAG: 50S ribosomal protein L30 [Bacteroidales bacterium]|nr:50S ribosomal protein L30 [Bacteroidales bacterium]
MDNKMLKIKQIRSSIGHPRRQKQTLEALGLRKINHERLVSDTPQIRGMIAKVGHLITVEEVSA